MVLPRMKLSDSTGRPSNDELVYARPRLLHLKPLSSEWLLLPPRLPEDFDSMFFSTINKK